MRAWRWDRVGLSLWHFVSFLDTRMYGLGEPKRTVPVRSIESLVSCCWYCGRSDGRLRRPEDGPVLHADQGDCSIRSGALDLLEKDVFYNVSVLVLS
jgi:hypothetical protein